MKKALKFMAGFLFLPVFIGGGLFIIEHHVMILPAVFIMFFVLCVILGFFSMDNWS